MVLTDEEKDEIINNHSEICNYLHEHMDDLPPKIKNELWDIVYSHYEP